MMLIGSKSESSLSNISDLKIQTVSVCVLIVFFDRFSPLMSEYSLGDNKEALSSVFYRIERNLRHALKPTYETLFERLNTHPGGLRFLSILRADLLSILT